ncbi:MAG: hypothetical protein FJ297_09220 [Planctomycetes bacterium]|nr:hypothetical protein [Planctomycetota bacterium]
MRRIRAPIHSALIVWTLAWRVTAAAQEPEPDEGSVRAAPHEGLVATYQSLADPARTARRIDAKPALALSEPAPHWRLPRGPFTARWEGHIEWRETSPVRLSLYVRGSVRVRLNGEVVLEAEGTDDRRHEASHEVSCDIGDAPIVIEYRSPEDGPSRLQLWWESESFALEPIAAWFFQHADAQRVGPLEQDLIRDSGRALSLEFGCARCHASHFADPFAPRPGPSLASARGTLSPSWVRGWLADPPSKRRHVHMPRLFSDDRPGFVERWVVADYLGRAPTSGEGDGPANGPAAPSPAGDHRMGRRLFAGYGCSACHFLPDQETASQLDAGQGAFETLGDRWTADRLAAFLLDPLSRYADGRMPSLPLTPEHARDIAAYLMLWSSPAKTADDPRPSDDELADLRRTLGADSADDLARRVLLARRCHACHAIPGGEEPVADIPLRAGATLDRSAPLDHCLGDRPSSDARYPRFAMNERQRERLAAYAAVRPEERTMSESDTRSRTLDWLGCARCHQRDTDRAPPIERIGATIGGAWLQRLPYQKTPRLTQPLQRLGLDYLRETLTGGVTGLRHPEYTYRMPRFGDRAPDLLRALAEADGELAAIGVSEPPNPPRGTSDPTNGSLHGPELVGFQGYACVSCHIWNGRMFADPDPGAVGPDLTRTSGRVRREFFDRFLDSPPRQCPGTPMPAVFPRGKPALLSHVLDGDADRQKDAIWDYLALGADAPPPKAALPMAIPAPTEGQPILVAQIPLHVQSDVAVESLSMLNADRTLAVFDLERGLLRRVVTGARITNEVAGRRRRFLLDVSEPVPWNAKSPGWLFRETAAPNDLKPAATRLLGYDRRADGVRVRMEIVLPAASVRVEEEIRFATDAGASRVNRAWKLDGIPSGIELVVPLESPSAMPLDVTRGAARVDARDDGDAARVAFRGDEHGSVAASLPGDRLSPRSTSEQVRGRFPDMDRPRGRLERPGYRAVEFALPRAESGEDLVMPTAIAATPDGKRVFVASTKLGELFELEGALGGPASARLADYARGLYQEAYSMLATNDTLFLLHRRNLTAVRDTDGDRMADQFDRVLGLPHEVADAYDYAYGLARDAEGRFVFGYAPYASRTIAGSGGAVRFDPGSQQLEPIAYGMRNPVGWCSDDRGEVFYTDNQGEWVATNKLCHVDSGHYYGFPNPEQREHAALPRGRTAIWIPYAWARSVNGVTFDSTQGRFGPFAGQFFLAELMYGGAIVRASVEQVKGQHQGVCFPFWGPGLLGPVTLAFHPSGPLFVGAITEPGWMAQPDRGGLFRIDFTGEVPFEMRTIRVLPNGFRVHFTREVDRASAVNPAHFAVEHYRYEYTGSYGSPELDRTAVSIAAARVAEDGRSVDLVTDPLVTDRVYMIGAPGIRSAQGEPLFQPAGAYTLHEIPDP